MASKMSLAVCLLVLVSFVSARPATSEPTESVEFLGIKYFDRIYTFIVVGQARLSRGEQGNEEYLELAKNILEMYYAMLDSRQFSDDFVRNSGLLQLSQEEILELTSIVTQAYISKVYGKLSREVFTVEQEVRLRQLMSIGFERLQSGKQTNEMLYPTAFEILTVYLHLFKVDEPVTEKYVRQSGLLQLTNYEILEVQTIVYQAWMTKNYPTGVYNGF